LSCHYDLKNLTEHRCPECGREFDPINPNTFDIPKPVDRKPWIVALSFCVIALWLLWMLIL